MLSLIVTILFSLGTTYIALQNSSNIALKLGAYTITNVPVYVIIMSSILTGIIITWLINSLNKLSTFLTLRSKEKIIADHQITISQLKQEIHELEIENAQLRRIEEEQEEENQDSEPEYSQQYTTRIAPSIR